MRAAFSFKARCPSTLDCETPPVACPPDDVEAQFYEALREADLDKLMAVWAEQQVARGIA